MTLDNLITERAGKTPEKICIKYENRKISFRELNAQVDTAAAGLKHIGVKKKDRVAILMENSPEYIISYFAIIRAGAVVVPVNIFLTTDEIAYIISDSDSNVLIYGDEFLSHIERIKRGRPRLIAAVFDEILLQEAEFNKDKDENRDDEVAVLLYTSGTTGFPKGAMLTHRNLISNAKACHEVIPLSGKDRILLFLPLFHSFSFTVCVILPIYAGATIVLLRSVKPFSKVINSVFRDRITFFVAVPTIYTILSKKKVPLVLRYLLRFLLSIKACISGAAALPEATIREFEKRFNLPLLEGYGLSEASPAVAVNPLKGKRKPTSVGPPIPGVEVAVIGKDGNKLPPGEIGELIVKGPNVMKGYYNRDEETWEVLKDGWLYTGDMARLDEDGYIYIVDRKKDVVIIDGMNVYPREIEEFIMKHPSVYECAMAGIPDGRGSEISLLFIRKKDGTALDEQEIRNYMKGRLARFKIPRRIIFIDEFPKTATGKIKKTELRKWRL